MLNLKDAPETDVGYQRYLKALKTSDNESHAVSREVCDSFLEGLLNFQEDQELSDAQMFYLISTAYVYETTDLSVNPDLWGTSSSNAEIFLSTLAELELAAADLISKET